MRKYERKEIEKIRFQFYLHISLLMMSRLPD